MGRKMCSGDVSQQRNDGRVGRLPLEKELPFSSINFVGKFKTKFISKKQIMTVGRDKRVMSSRSF